MTKQKKFTGADVRAIQKELMGLLLDYRPAGHLYIPDSDVPDPKQQYEEDWHVRWPLHFGAPTDVKVVQSEIVEICYKISDGDFAICTLNTYLGSRRGSWCGLEIEGIETVAELARLINDMHFEWQIDDYRGSKNSEAGPGALAVAVIRIEQARPPEPEPEPGPADKETMAKRAAIYRQIADFDAVLEDALKGTGVDVLSACPEAEQDPDEPVENVNEWTWSLSLGRTADLGEVTWFIPPSRADGEKDEFSFWLDRVELTGKDYTAADPTHRLQIGGFNTMDDVALFLSQFKYEIRGQSKYGAPKIAFADIGEIDDFITTCQKKGV